MAKRIREEEMAKAVYTDLHLEDDNRLEVRITKSEFYKIMRTNGLGSQNTTLQGMWYRFTKSEFTYTEGGVEVAVLNVYLMNLVFGKKNNTPAPAEVQEASL